VRITKPRGTNPPLKTWLNAFSLQWYESSVLDALFPGDVVTAWGDPSHPAKPLFPEEEAFVARAVPKRQREFAKGRECARTALARLGLPGVALLSGKSREPLWPTEAVGSITHTAGLCAVAVARSERYAGIGIDAELAHPLQEAVMKHVCREEELAQTPGFPSLESAILPRLRFSAKEAIYKCLFPITRTFWGFQDVSVVLEDGSFHAILHVSAPSGVDGRIFGQWRRAGAHLVTAVWINRTR
jgi:4'-phosphopantetheinyl transferase EntD